MFSVLLALGTYVAVTTVAEETIISQPELLKATENYIMDTIRHIYYKY